MKKYAVYVAVLFSFVAESGQAKKIPHKAIDLTQQILLAKAVASESVIVESVRKHNLGLPIEFQNLDNSKWRKVGVLDPIVKTLTQNEAARYLRKVLPKYITEAFISGNDGKKVALLKKTTYWDHSRQDKHEIPMKNKVWQGQVERDSSTGIYQIQVSVPILHDGVPVGSVTLGISVVELGLSGDVK